MKIESIRTTPCALRMKIILAIKKKKIYNNTLLNLTCLDDVRRVHNSFANKIIVN